MKKKLFVFYFFSLLLFFIGAFLSFSPTASAATLYNNNLVNGTKVYLFESVYGGACSNHNPHEEEQHMIIVPENGNIQSIYMYFHGLGSANNTVDRLCTGYHNLCNHVKTMKDQGENIAFIVPRLSKDGSSSNYREFSTTELNCFLDKAKEQLREIGQGVGNGFHIAAHSAGGKSAMEALKSNIRFNNYSPQNTLIFDGCYGSWCDTIVNLPNRGNLYLYGGKGNGSTINEMKTAFSKASNKGNIRLLEFPENSHSTIPKICFTDHKTADACGGRGTLIEQGRPSTPDTPATPSSSTTDTGVVNGSPEEAEVQREQGRQEVQDNAENIFAGTRLQTSIPGFDFDFLKSKLTTSVEEDGTIILKNSLFAEYIAAIYRFSVIVIPIIAVVIIIFSGIQWTASGGNQSIIGDAKKRIIRAFVTLMLILGGYSFLYFINPNLIQIGQFQLPTIRYEVYLQEAENTITSFSTVDYNIKQPTWTHATFDCSKANQYEPMGVMPQNLLITYTCDGIRGNITTIPEMKDPLCKVGALAKEEGYELRILGATGTYRPFKRQVELWCADNRPTLERKGAIAVPGNSNHGTGRAIDVFLFKDGKQLTFSNTRPKSNGDEFQCDSKLEYVEKIADLFYRADPKFVRYEREIWHFEYGTSGMSLRAKYKGYPASCANYR